MVICADEAHAPLCSGPAGLGPGGPRSGPWPRSCSAASQLLLGQVGTSLKHSCLSSGMSIMAACFPYVRDVTRSRGVSYVKVLCRSALTYGGKLRRSVTHPCVFL